VSPAGSTFPAQLANFTRSSRGSYELLALTGITREARSQVAPFSFEIETDGFNLNAALETAVCRITADVCGIDIEAYGMDTHVDCIDIGYRHPHHSPVHSN
jgi:hypothetical protein